MEGRTEWEGRLEVCFSQRWGTVSSDGWTLANAQVVCKDLGYELNISDGMYAIFGCRIARFCHTKLNMQWQKNTQQCLQEIQSL